MKGKKALQDEALKNVSGGFIFEDSRGVFQIIDEDGNVLELFHSEEEALKYCEENGISNKRINWEEVSKLREEYAKKHKGPGIPGYDNPPIPIPIKPRK